MAGTNLVAHQTSPGALLNLGYNPTALSRFKSQKGEDESPAASGGRPGWVDNPPEGMTVGKGTSKSMGLAKQKAGVGGTQTHTEVDNGVYTVYVLMPAPDRPEEPLQDTEDTDIGLEDYESPELEIDLEDLASTQYEDAEGPAVNPYSLEEEEEEEAVTSPASRMSLGYDSDLESQLMGQFDRETTPTPSRSLLDTPTAGRLKEKRDANIAALDERAAVGNQQQAAIAESTDYRRGGGQDINVLPSDGAEERERLVEYGKTRPEATIRPSRTAGMRAPDMQRVEQSALPGAGAAQAAQEEEQGDGLMSRLAGLGGGIGGFVKDNPDLVLQGLQTAGELGGAYKRGRREEEAAKRMAEEARMGTAISALTRGRVNPSVAPQMPRTSAGESMFDVMAGVGRGGQEFMAGKRQRADKLRAEGIEEDEIARQTARDEELMGLDRYRAETERMGVTGKIEAGEDDEGVTEAQQKVDDAAMIMSHVSGLLETFDEGGWTETGGVAGLFGPRNYMDAARIQQSFESQKIALYAFMKELAGLGRLSDKDVELINDTLPDKFTGEARVQGAYEGIAKVLERTTGGGFTAGPSPFEEGYDPERNKRMIARSATYLRPAKEADEEPTPEQLELIDRAFDDDLNIVDEDAYAELERLGIIQP